MDRSDRMEISKLIAKLIKESSDWFSTTQFQLIVSNSDQTHNHEKNTRFPLKIHFFRHAFCFPRIDHLNVYMRKRRNLIHIFVSPSKLNMQNS